MVIWDIDVKEIEKYSFGFRFRPIVGLSSSPRFKSLNILTYMSICPIS